MDKQLDKTQILSNMKNLVLNDAWKTLCDEIDKRYINQLQEDIEGKEYKDMTEFNADRKILKLCKEIKELPNTIISCYTTKDNVDIISQYDPYQQ